MHANISINNPSFTLGSILALMLVGPNNCLKQLIYIKHNRIKKPQLAGGKPAGYLQARPRIDLGTTENKSS